MRNLSIRKFFYLSISAAFIMLFMSTVSLAEPESKVLVVNGKFKFSPMQGKLWLADEDSVRTANSFLDAFSSGQNGTYLSEQVPNLGSTLASRWIGFQVRNSLDRPVSIIVEVDFIGADNINFYAWNRDSMVKKVEGMSWRTVFSERDVSHRVPAFKMELAPGGLYVLALSFRQEVGSMVLPILVHEEHAFEEYSSMVNLTHGLTVGFLLLAVLVGVTFWLLTRQEVYGYYGIYVIGICGFILEEQGYLNQVMLGRWDRMASQAAWPVFSQIAIIGHTLFAIHFLRLHQIPGFRHWVILGKAVSGLAGAMILWELVGPAFNNFTYLASLTIAFLYVVLSFVYLVLAIREKFPESYFYIFAVGPLFLSIAYAVGATIGIFPQGWMLYILISYTPAWEICLLFIGLVKRFTSEQRERIAALEQLTNWQAQLIQAIDNAQESERERIGANLHDDTGNTLVAARLKLGMAAEDSVVVSRFPDIYVVIALIDHVMENLRNISHNLMPIEFKKYRLTKVIQQAVDRANTGSIHFEMFMEGAEYHFAPEKSQVIYRIVNELINNVVKHSSAENAQVQAVFTENELMLSVEDDGIGFAPELVRSESEGIGIKNIVSRADFLGADIDFFSDDTGTCVTITIPYN